MKAHGLKRLLVLILLGLSSPTFSQSFYGEVIDADNSEPLQYANIGIVGKNIGGIAFRDGKFNITLKGMASSDTIKVSYIGYQSQLISAATLDLSLYHKIRLKPAAVLLKPIIVSEKKQSKILGNAKAGQTRTGWGDLQSLRGRIRGLKITGIECSVKAKSFCFKIDDNEWDSVAFRLNFLEVRRVVRPEKVYFLKTFSSLPARKEDGCASTWNLIISCYVAPLLQPSNG